MGEGAQDPYLILILHLSLCTSSNTTAAGACTGLGIAPNKINNVFGIFQHILQELVVVHFLLSLRMKLEEEWLKLVMNLEPQQEDQEDADGWT